MFGFFYYKASFTHLEKFKLPPPEINDLHMDQELSKLTNPFEIQGDWQIFIMYIVSMAL